MNLVRGAALVGGLLVVAGVTACGAEADADDVVSSTPPPPTSGVQPWGSDLHGFEQARCDGDDLAIRMVWRTDSRFTVCRNASGSRYLRAWTTTDPSALPRGEQAPYGAMRGDFFTDTPNSVQFMAGGAKVDIGPTIVTIIWPKEPGSRVTTSTSIETGPGWTRLD